MHHVTAIATNAKRNYDFYTPVLGLRLVKKTVNFDDPGTYHFYFGNETGDPGTLLTFFPWENAGKGKPGFGMTSEVSYAVPEGSLAFWSERFKSLGIQHDVTSDCFGEQYLPFQDFDGLSFRLIVPATSDERKSWETYEIKKSVATKGFHSVGLTLKKIDATAEILTGIFGYHLSEQKENRYRFVTNAIDNASIIDLIESPTAQKGIVSGGTVHHIAFRVNNEVEQMAFRDKVAVKGLNITGSIDRNYFHSVYFREPGGVLFEIATDNPGFAIDETVDALGKSLRLPSRYEANRAAIEKALPILH